MYNNMNTTKIIILLAHKKKKKFGLIVLSYAFRTKNEWGEGGGGGGGVFRQSGEDFRV